jgi:hypothetical protein
MAGRWDVDVYRTSDLLPQETFESLPQSGGRSGSERKARLGSLRAPVCRSTRYEEDPWMLCAET